MSAQVKALRSSLHELEGLLENNPPLMSASMEKSVGNVIKYGAAFAEVSSAHPHKNEQDIDPF